MVKECREEGCGDAAALPNMLLKPGTETARWTPLMFCVRDRWTPLPWYLCCLIGSVMGTVESTSSCETNLSRSSRSTKYFSYQLSSSISEDWMAQKLSCLSVQTTLCICSIIHKLRANWEWQSNSQLYIELVKVQSCSAVHHAMTIY